MRLACLVGSLVWGRICSVEIEIYVKIDVVLFGAGGLSCLVAGLL